MKVAVYDLEGKKGKTVDMPSQFKEPIRQDLIMRAFLTWRSNQRQPYGAYHKAGQRVSAKLSRRRRQYKGSYGHGISRVPRKILWRRGTQFGWVGAFASGMYKGRRAHPPKAEKILNKKINDKERKKALRSALAASLNLQLVRQRGHKVTELANVISTQLEEVKKTKEVKEILTNLKLGEELSRVAEIKVRAGKGKMRGRKYKTKTGPLIVVSQNCPVIKSAKNIQGVDVCAVKTLNISFMAPGGIPGRLTLFTDKALETMREAKLFTDEKTIVEKKVKPKKEAKKKRLKKKLSPKKIVKEESKKIVKEESKKVVKK